MGNRFFAVDFRAQDNPAFGSNLDVLTYAETKPIFDSFYDFVESHQDELGNGMVSLPNLPSKKLFCNSEENGVCLSTVNIINHDLYNYADPTTYSNFILFNDVMKNGILHATGVETTHAVVNMAAINEELDNPIPVTSVSPIVNRFTHFEETGDGRWGKQYGLGSYNAGIVMANLLESFRNEL